MVKCVIRDFGHVDVIVNNAYSASYVAFIDYPETEWEKTLNNTLKGYFLCGQAVAREMIKRQHGRLINTSSVSGELALIRTTAYSVWKAGINIMTR